MMPRQTGFWSKRTGLERGLLLFLGVAGVVAMAGGSVIAIANGAENVIKDETVKNLDDPAPVLETCTSPECVIAASEIIQGMDLSIDPCEDFYLYACQGWINTHVIPESKSSWGRFYELREEVDQKIRAMVERPIDVSDAESVKSMKSLYQSCLDGVNSFNDYSTFLDALVTDRWGGWPMIKTIPELGLSYVLESLIGESGRLYQTADLLSVYPYLDNFDTSRNILYVDQTSLGLARSMLVAPDDYADYVTAYKNYIIDVARVISREAGTFVDDIQLIQRADNIFEFESRLASGTVDSGDRRNATEMYNPKTYGQLKQEYPIYWDLYFSEFLADTSVVIDDSEEIILVEPEYMDWLLPMLIATPDDVIADFVYWKRAESLVSLGPQELQDIKFAFDSVLSGQASATPRWSTCVAEVASESSGFAYAVGQVYINEYFDDATKAKANLLVNDIRSAFVDLLDESVWMDTETQVLAKEKAELIVQLVGYPDWLPDNVELDNFYSAYPTISSGDDHMASVLKTRKASQGVFTETLRKTPDRSEWITQPAIVNAFYSPNHNSISFPAGILQPPFFGSGYPRYLNYGAIGVVMGHEITHGFDDQGRQYDGYGSITQWWTTETIDAFVTQAQCYIDQYNNYTIPELEDALGEDAHVNGQNTQGENIADNGGLHEAFRAYTKSVEALGPEGPLPGLEQFTAEQMFFIAYAQTWCEKRTESSQINQILTDPHSPGKYRVWGPLSNSPDFVAAYNCPVGSNMNRDDKCVLW